MQNSIKKFTTVIACAAAMSLGLAACGSDNPTGSTGATDNGTASAPADAKADLNGTVAGAGASSQKVAVNAWKAGFNSANPNAQVEYDPVGSGSGVKKFLAREVAFAGSDEPLKAEDQKKAAERCGAPALHIPVYISPIAVIFNLDGIEHLNLTAPVVANIFSGKITKWNDPAIAALNEGVNLPDLAITPVHRADGSGTTYNFTEWLHTAAPAEWTADPNKNWPFEGTNGEKTQGVVELVKTGKGSIGYADDSAATGLGTVKIGNAAGGFVAVSSEAAAKTLDESELQGESEADLQFKINRTPKADDAYPIILVSYDVICSAYTDANEGKIVKAFVEFATSEAGQKLANESAKSAPLSPALREKITKSLAGVQVK